MHLNQKIYLDTAAKKIFMNDEDESYFFQERENRIVKNCGICENSGWHINDTFVPSINLINCSSNCNHYICANCLKRYATSQIESHNNNGIFMTTLKCPFPYGFACAGILNEKIWRFFIDPILLERQNSLRQVYLARIAHDANQGSQGLLANFPVEKLKLFCVSCTNCHQENLIPEPESYWECSHCNRYSCGRCDRVECECAGKNQQSLARGYSHTFNELCGTGGTRPLRRHEVNRSMLDGKIAEINEHFPWTHAKCPTCKTSIFKTTACNDIKHCGSQNVCFFCQHISFPWENGIKSEHWKNCTRFDSEISGFPCIDGQCRSDNNECSKIDHEPFIKSLHGMRREAAIRLIKKDNPLFF